MRWDRAQLEEVADTLRDRIAAGLSELPSDAEELKRQEIALAERAAQLGAMKKQLLAKEEALSRGMLAAPSAVAPVAESRGPDMVKRTEEFSRKEQEYALKVGDLESRLAHAELSLRQKEETFKFAGGPGKVVDKEVLRKIEDAQRIERTLVVRDQDIQKLREELRIRDEEMTKLKEPLRYKEEEMLRREEDLMFREKLLMEEQKKVARTQAELTSTDELTLKKRLEELQADVTAKEEEIRSKEKYLGMKEEELRTREQGLIGDEIEKREANHEFERVGQSEPRQETRSPD